MPSLSFSSTRTNVSVGCTLYVASVTFSPTVARSPAQTVSVKNTVGRAEDYFAALAKPLALDADGAGDEEEQPTRDPHTLAVGFLLRLRRTGWLEEQPGSYEGEASLSFVPEVAPLLEALEEILNPRVVTYTGKLYKAWQLLGSIGQEKSPYENVLREVH